MRTGIDMRDLRFTERWLLTLKYSLSGGGLVQSV